jgi:hypothetical protein
MIVLKAILLQIYWFYAVYYGPKIHDLWIALPSLALVTLNFIIYKPKITPLRYFVLVIIFSLYGFLQDCIFTKTGVLKYNESYLPIWINTLFWVFITYYGDIFNYIAKMKKSLLAITGGVGGCLAYFGGSRLGSIEQGEMVIFVTGVFISWAIFFPLSVWLWYESPIGANHEKPA